MSRSGFLSTWVVLVGWVAMWVVQEVVARRDMLLAFTFLHEGSIQRTTHEGKEEI